MSRVVFGNNSERGRWLRLDALLQDIAGDEGSDASIVPSVSRRSDAVALLSQPENLEPATASAASSQEDNVALVQELPLGGPSISGLDGGCARLAQTISVPGASALRRRSS